MIFRFFRFQLSHANDVQISPLRQCPGVGKTHYDENTSAMVKYWGGIEGCIQYWICFIQYFIKMLLDIFSESRDTKTFSCFL